MNYRCIFGEKLATLGGLPSTEKSQPRRIPRVFSKTLSKPILKGKREKDGKKMKIRGNNFSSKKNEVQKSGT